MRRNSDRHIRCRYDWTEIALNKTESRAPIITKRLLRRSFCLLQLLLPATSRSYNRVAKNDFKRSRKFSVSPLLTGLLSIWALIHGDSPPSTVSTFTTILSNEYKLITTGDDTSVFVIKQKENPYNSMVKVVK